MIEVHVILKPHGIDYRAEQIGELTIINDMQHPERPEFGSYRISIEDKEYRVKSHKRHEGIWKLIHTAIGLHIR